MSFTLNATPIRSATATIPRFGLWHAVVSMAGDLAIAVADGTAVTLVLGDTTFSGYVDHGDTFVDDASFTVVAGAGGWSKPVAAKSYRNDNGVLLSTVATDLAAAAGEQLDLASLVDQVLGAAWTRPAGSASSAMAALFPGGWRLDPDGVARPGPRPPAALPAALELAVEEAVGARRWARVSLPGDQVSALLPGAILTAPTLTTPIVVGTTTIRASVEAVTLDLLGEGGAVELFAALVQALCPSRIFGGLWTYQVADVDNGRPNLRALASVAGLPAELLVDKIPGLPGATSTLAAGALVLVGFRDGNPARPFVAGYLPGTLPASVQIDASGSVAIGPSASSVALGAAAARVVREGDHYAIGTTTGPLTFVSTPQPTGPSKVIA